jgi:hypothetical protein
MDQNHLFLSDIIKKYTPCYTTIPKLIIVNVYHKIKSTLILLETKLINNILVFITFLILY